MTSLLPSASADVIIDKTRINIDIGFDPDKGFDLGLHDEITNDLYDADEVLLYVSEANRRLMPDDPDYQFIGAKPGETVWVLPAVFDPGRLSVGVSAEDIEDGTFESYFEDDPRVQATGAWVKLTLMAVRGPGEVSVWQNGAFGKPIVWMATSDGITDEDAVFVLSGRDADYNWGFTQPGIYEIDVVASAYLGPDGDDLVWSEVVTYTFGVETTDP